jgi:predicted ATP-dependent protease
MDERKLRRAPAASRHALKPAQLHRRVVPAGLPFRTTADVEPLEGTVGQPRALSAIEFGLGIQTVGFNLFVAGRPGSGRAQAVRDELSRLSQGLPAPDDWVYVHNFADPERPNAIRLPAGFGPRLAADMAEFVRAAVREIPRVFDSEDVAKRRAETLAALAARRDEEGERLAAFAREREFTLEMTPAGVASVPLVNGQPLSREEFAKLPQERQHEIEQRGEEVQAQVATFMRELRQLEKETAERSRVLDREIATFVMGPHLDELGERYEGVSEVRDYLAQVRDDFLDHLDDFRDGEDAPTMAVPGLPFMQVHRPNHDRYGVNILVSNGDCMCAPIVVERNPSFANLIGRVEYRHAYGAMVTDFQEIKAGALHRANGGFLVLEAADVLMHPFSWSALKRSLRACEVRIENLGEEVAPLPVATLRPEPIPLHVKVVLIGTHHLFQLLYQLDEDFPELFKVKAEFSPDMTRDEAGYLSYAGAIARWVRDFELRHFDRGAVARVVEHGGVLVEDQRKLSTRLLDISDLVAEASFWAGKAGRDVVSAADVERAVRERRSRSALVEERLQEAIDDGTIAIDTSGEKVGQVNGLAVLDLGDHSFGKPSRITARVALGHGSVVSIEREIELSGPIHSKGFLTLAGYLAGTYAQEFPLALQATLTFEQAYEGIDGDSASSTELYALLSALADVPIRQGLAVTGSVNQLGDIQAVGGVTRKIEGYFQTCKARGLTGEQGVIVPHTNVSSLLLDDEIVAAVRARLFHVYAVRSVDEGIELLTGVAAGKRRPDGTWQPGTIHALVEDRLRAYSDKSRASGEDKAAVDTVGGAAKAVAEESS